MVRKAMVILALMVAAFGLAAQASAQVLGEQVDKVDASAEVLREVMNIPEEGIPEALLNNAQGIAVIPSVIKAAFGIGGRYGEGVLVVRQPNGNWSDPLFISLTGGSIGWQVGAESADIVLVFRTQRSIDAIASGKFTLGLDASVAAGPVGRHAEADTDILLRAEIYSYSRSRGLFAGLSLGGSVIQVDTDANIVFYGSSSVTPNAILSGRVARVPNAARRFTCTVASYTNTPMRACA